MTPYVVTIEPDASVVQAATKMVAQKISCIIVAERGRLLGIITERDFIKNVPPSSRALNLKVREIMTPEVVTISPDETLVNAHIIMREHGFRKLIVKEGDQIAGIITQTDVVKAAGALKYVDHVHDKTKDWLTPGLVTVKQGGTFAAAKKLMAKKDVGSLVIEKGGKPIGIFTEYDVVAQFYDAGGMLSIKSPDVIMHAHIRCIGKEMSIFLANRIMLEKDNRRLLVVDGDKVVGIITQTDIAWALMECVAKMSEGVRDCVKVERKKPIISTFANEHLKVYSLKKK